MSDPAEPGKYLDRVILLFLFALFLFVSPLVTWWATPEQPWYLPYLLWALIIVLAFWLQQRRGA
jgi:hypothetical protein